MRRKILNFVVAILLCSLSGYTSGQLSITEITVSGQIEITNGGTDSIDLNQYWLCNRPQYDRVGTLAVECGAINLGPGEVVTVTASTITISGSGDELGLFTNSQFSDANSMVDYVIWGERAGSTRESTAVEAGLWTLGERVDSISEGNSLQYVGEGNSVSDYAILPPTVCASLPVDSCNVTGGNIALSDGTTEIALCQDDTLASSLEVTVDSAQGAMEAWVITDTAGIILEVPLGSPFNFETKSSEVCYVQHLSYEEGLIGASIGEPISGLDGCYALSNSIKITILDSTTCATEPCTVSAGQISTASGQTSTVICADDEISSVTVISAGGAGAEALWLVTDTLGTILSVSEVPVFDFGSSEAGSCLIWEAKHDGSLTGAIVDSSASGLAGCFALSNAIMVSKLSGDQCPEDECEASGGDLTIEGGSTEITICAGDGISDAFDVVLEGHAGSNAAWVITDEDGNILAFPLSPPFNFEGAGGGVALIYNLSYEAGISGASLGSNINALEGCYGLSNPIRVNRNLISGGSLSLVSGSTEIMVCEDGSPFIAFDVVTNNVVGLNNRWVLSDDDGTILAFPLAPPFDLEGTIIGANHLQLLTYQEGTTGIEIGANTSEITGCFAFTNPITIYRNAIDGGVITTANGGNEITVCVGDGISDAFEVSLMGAQGSNSLYVVTDTTLRILALSESAIFDFEEQDAGTCLIWHLSYSGDLEGGVVDSSAADLSGCFDLSDPITVHRVSGDDCPEPCLIEGGLAAFEGGETSMDICADDSLSDLILLSVSDATGSINSWIVTDEAGNILSLPANDSLDLDGTGQGMALVRNISYEEDVMLPEIGDNINELSGCFALSNSLIINRLTGDDCPFVCMISGSTIETQEGTTSISLCTDDGDSDAVTIAKTGGTGADDTYLITDADANIINIAMGNIIDLEGAGSGTCLIWHVSSVGTLSGVALGANAGNIEGCYALSNAITVEKLIGDQCLALCGTDGGTVSYEGGGNEMEFCSGDVEFTITHTSDANPELDYYYILTDAQDNIVEVRNSNEGGAYNMNALAQGVSHIWGWSTDGTIEPEIGASIGTLEGECSELTGNFVNVSRVTGGQCDIGCHAPRDVRIRKAGEGRYKIRWDKVKEAEGYEMEIGFEGFPLSFALVELNRNKATINGPEDRVIQVRVRAVCANGEKSPYTQDFFIESSSSSNAQDIAILRSTDKIEVSEIFVSEQEILYPNPADNYINIWYDGQGWEAQMSIISRNGQRVMTQTLPGDIEIHEIDIQQLPKGLYFMTIHSANGQRVQEKFIKSDTY